MTAPEFLDANQNPSEPVRHESLSVELAEQIQSIHDVLGPYFSESLEQFKNGFLQEANPEQAVAGWIVIMLVWMDYHEKYLDGENMSDADERKLLSALIEISSGAEDPAKLGVPVQIGRRLFDCYEELEEELDEKSGDQGSQPGEEAGDLEELS